MPTNIKNPDVERLAAEVGHAKALEERRARLRRTHEDRIRFLETRIWSEVPDSALGQRRTKKQRETVLGYGPEGV